MEGAGSLAQPAIDAGAPVNVRFSSPTLLHRPFGTVHLARPPHTQPWQASVTTYRDLTQPLQASVMIERGELVRLSAFLALPAHDHALSGRSASLRPLGWETEQTQEPESADARGHDGLQH